MTVGGGGGAAALDASFRLHPALIEIMAIRETVTKTVSVRLC
jgi:hypothetical protein